jgi:N-acetyl-gamma-glutamyl-phosphate reductase
MAKVKVGIVGGAGYTGGELIRILLNHPSVDITFIHSRSNAGKPVHDVHADVLGDTKLMFSDHLEQGIDVLFLCVGHGEAKTFLSENEIESRVRVIDLSQDFRIAGDSSFDDRKFVYGLPELNRQQIASSKNIANPGCFATGIQLGLLPLAQKNLLDQVYTTGITGSTGAGQALTSSSHFSWRANNIQAYKTLSHQHIREIGQSIRQLSARSPVDVNFIPWRGDFTRGIFVSSQIKYEGTLASASELFEEFYADHPFTHISKSAIFLKQVVNTNKCIIHLEKVGTILVVHSIIDNLLKGASGQAVQNMNIMMGLDECEGLRMKATAF